jgi:hypothetical protein
MVLSSLCGALLTAAERPALVETLNLEAHGFVSFGYLETARNNWLGDTLSGTGEFWEAAANVIVRPVDRLRIGAQVFARDLVKYDNGRVDLDWAYADYRFADAIGVQVGRVKLPLALYNESLDVDAARAQVFLAPSVYALRSRDLFISTDGAKVYGSIDAAGAGSFDYGVFIGAKSIDPDAGFATFMGELGLGPVINDISADWLGGAMLHWNTPVEGLGLRFSIGDLHHFSVAGGDAAGTYMTRTMVDDYLEWWASLLYELPEVTLVAEYTRVHGRGETRIEPGPLIIPLVDNTEGAYLACTWHATSWFEAYLGVEGAWADAYDRSRQYAYTGVVAANFMPLPNWSLKLELRGVRGTLGINANDNPQGVDDRWGVLALKTTVDF